MYFVLKNKGTNIRNKNLNPFFITVFFQVLQHAIELSSSLKQQRKVPNDFLFYYTNAELLLEDFANYNFKVKLKLQYLSNISIA